MQAAYNRLHLRVEPLDGLDDTHPFLCPFHVPTPAINAADGAADLHTGGQTPVEHRPGDGFRRCLVPRGCLNLNRDVHDRAFHDKRIPEGTPQTYVRWVEARGKTLLRNCPACRS